MQAVVKFMQFSLLLVVTLTTMGMRVKLDDCHGKQAINVSFAGSPDCCCDKSAAQKLPCADITCLVQAPAPLNLTNRQVQAQQAEALKPAPATFAFTHFIRPVLQAKIPHFTLPPPASGRFLGILHQSFII